MIAALNTMLAMLILGLAAWTVIARGTFAAAVGFVAFGMTLTLAWVQLQGVDVALMEGAIGGGLTGAMLILAAGRLRATEAAARAERPGPRIRIAAAVVAACLTAALAAAVLALPSPAPTLAHATADNLAATGVGNPITGVLMAFRAMDTLLEAIVVLFTVIGVWSLAPDGAWGGRPGRLHRVDPNTILAYLARVLPPIGIVVSVYIFWIGAELPGGKFQSASILAAMWLLVVMAGLTDAPPISRPSLRLALIGGPVVFIAIGAAGVVTAGEFLAYPDGFAKPLIKVIEFALLPSLALALALILAGAPKRPAR